MNIIGNNTYYTYSVSGGMGTTSSAGYGVSNNTYGHSANSGNINHRSEQPTYRIGQNRVITSAFQQPKMAVVTDLTSMHLGGGNAYSEQDVYVSTIRRVNGGGHQSDPVFTPVGNVPLLFLLTCACAFLIYKCTRKQS